jgi:hypothetical protein
LRRTGLTDAALKPLAGLKGLRTLRLSGNITDAGVVYLAQLGNLDELWLQDTKVSDAGVAHLRGLKKLKYFSVWGSPVSNAALEDLWKYLPQLVIRASKGGVPAKKGEPLGRAYRS